MNSSEHLQPCVCCKCGKTIEDNPQEKIGRIFLCFPKGSPGSRQFPRDENGQIIEPTDQFRGSYNAKAHLDRYICDECVSTVKEDGRDGFWTRDYIVNEYFLQSRGDLLEGHKDELQDMRVFLWSDIDTARARGHSATGAICKCDDCGNPMHIIKFAGRSTGKYVCLTCQPSNGTCPFCRSILRTTKAQQCAHCKRSWHSTVDDTPPNASAGKPDTGNSVQFSSIAFLFKLALAPVAFIGTLRLVSATEIDLDDRIYLFTILGVIVVRLLGSSPLYLILPLLIGMKHSIMNGIRSGSYSDLTLESVATVFGIAYVSSFIMYLPNLILNREPNSADVSSPDK